MADETLTHRLILPRDANHHGTLYAGTLVSLALEAGYATAYRAVGASANLVLKRVLDLRCYHPVAIGRVIEIRGVEVVRARAMVVVAMQGTPLAGRDSPWMDGLLQFAQIGDDGRPAPIEAGPRELVGELPTPWAALRERSRKLLGIRR